MALVLSGTWLLIAGPVDYITQPNMLQDFPGNPKTGGPYSCIGYEVLCAHLGVCLLERSVLFAVDIY